MRKFSALFVILASTALYSLPVMAQDHAGHAVDGADDTPVAVVTPEVSEEPAGKVVEKVDDKSAEDDRAAEREKMGPEKPAAEQAAPVPYKPATISTPGQAWRVIEESVRNISDAMKVPDITGLPRYSDDMSRAMAALLAAKIHADLKPDEKDHLYNSLQNLNESVEELAVAVAANDQEQISAAVNQLNGVVTLTRIDVPPGLLERVSGAQVRAEIVNTPVLKKGEEVTVTLRLKSAVSGKPLRSTDLKNVHTSAVHALVIDPQLVDYTHAHPDEIDVPGEYTFKMTPQTNCTYRLWADITPQKGTQEFAMVDIPGVEGCGTVAIDKTPQMSAAVDGYKVALKIDGDLGVGRNSTLSFEVVNQEGESVTTLAPIMGAYAHVVGFYDDYRSIAHLHPLGDAPKKDDDRGASPLKFQFKPERAGFVRLYMQVSMEGKEIVFPLGLTVRE